jgi:hypothetical protein
MTEAWAPHASADRHETELLACLELECLPGVLAAGVWLNSDGKLRDARIHIMPGVAPTIIANAAARVFQAIGIPYEQRAIRTSVLAVPDEIQSVALTTSASSGRILLLQDVSLARTGAHVTCRVQLMRGDAPATGEARELDTTSGRVRAAANATLRAAENTAEGLALGLEAAVITDLFGRSYAVVSVEASIGRRIATLSGIVPVEPTRAPEEAACMATLRAIDRWIGL